MESGLKIGFWNINGFSEEKMSDEAFKGEINKYDILFLCETWLRREIINNVSFQIDISVTLFFEIKGEKKGRPSGGF